jgi:CHAD domain-containing protein
MAKAREVPLSADEPFEVAGRRVVGARAEELFEHADGVLDTEDIERVHAMRVASRRLRAVLEIFAPCFDRDLHRSVLRDVKAIADALGERRDPDVHLEALAALEARVPEDQRGGVQHLAGLQRRRQELGNDVLAAALQDMTGSDLRGRLEALVAEPSELA